MTGNGLCQRVYGFGPYKLHATEALLDLSGSVVPLPPQALLVLCVLVENRGRIVTKQDLATAVWDDVVVEDSSIFKNIAVIRRELAAGLGGVDPIRTVSKKGYQFVLPVEVIESPETASTDLPSTTVIHQLPPARPTRKWAVVALTAAAFALGVLAWRAVYPKSAFSIRRSVAIAGIRNLSDDRSSDWLATALAETLTYDIGADGELRSIPPETVIQARKELGFAAQPALAEGEIQKLCLAVDCRVAITGSYIPYMNEIRLDLQVRDGDTGQIRTSLSKTGRKDQLFDLVARAGDEIRRSLGLAEVASQTRREVAATLSARPEVEQLYAEGLARLREMDPPAASEILRRAVAAQSDYAPAHAALSSAWAQMGFDGRARDEAKSAMDHRSGLPRQEQLRIEAAYFASLPDWPKAIAKWQALREFYPDDPEYTRKLLAAMTAGGKAKDVPELVRGMRAPVPDAAILLEQAIAFESTSNYQQARTTAALAIAGARAKSSRFLLSRALLAEGRAYFRLSDFEHSLTDYKEARDVSASLGDKAGVARALTYQANDLSTKGSGDPEPLLLEALKNAREIGDRRAMMLAIDSLASIHRTRADLAGAGKLYEEGLLLARETGSGGQEALSEISIANILNNTGHLEEARARYQRGFEKAVEVADRRTQTIALGNIGILDYQTGDLAGGRASLERTLALKRELGDRNSEAYTLGHLGMLLQFMGDLPGARKYLEEQSRILAAIGEKPTGNLVMLAELAIEEGHPEQAEEPLSKIAAESDRPSPASRASRALASARLARGDLRGARAAADRAVEIAKKSANAADFGIPAAIVEARVTAAEGKTDRAVAKLRAALTQAQKLKRAQLEFEARLAIAGARLQGRDAAAARAELTSIERDSEARSCGLIARKARQLRTGETTQK